jgi:hypothetical protein
MVFHVFSGIETPTTTSEDHREDGMSMFNVSFAIFFLADELWAGFMFITFLILFSDIDSFSLSPASFSCFVFPNWSIFIPKCRNIIVLVTWYYGSITCDGPIVAARMLRAH